MHLEIEAVLDRRVGARPSPFAALRLLGTGFGHAFGISGQLQIIDDSGSPAAATRQDRPGGADADDLFVARAQLMGEWWMLRGAQDRDMPELIANGFDPGAARREQEQRAQQEREQAERFNEDPRWRRGRIRNVIGARYLIVEMMEMLSDGLESRGSSLDDLLGDDRNTARAICR